MCRQITTNGVFLTGMWTVNHISKRKWHRELLSCILASLEISVSTVWQSMSGGLHCTLCTSESVLLQHVSREALTPVRARRVDTSVVADVALIYQALIHVLHLHCILPILLVTNGEGLFRVQAVRHYSTQREWLIFSQSMKCYICCMNNYIKSYTAATKIRMISALACFPCNVYFYRDKCTASTAATHHIIRTLNKLATPYPWGADKNTHAGQQDV